MSESRLKPTGWHHFLVSLQYSWVTIPVGYLKCRFNDSLMKGLLGIFWTLLVSLSLLLRADRMTSPSCFILFTSQMLTEHVGLLTGHLDKCDNRGVRGVMSPSQDREKHMLCFQVYPVNNFKNDRCWVWRKSKSDNTSMDEKHKTLFLEGLSDKTESENELTVCLSWKSNFNS